MQSKYWEIREESYYILHLKANDWNYNLHLFRDSENFLVADYGCGMEEVPIYDMVVFIAMMQEAHELAQQHFGEQWGIQ